MCKLTVRNILESFRVLNTAPTDDTMDFISSLQQKLGEVAAQGTPHRHNKNSWAFQCWSRTQLKLKDSVKASKLCASSCMPVLRISVCMASKYGELTIRLVPLFPL